MKLHPDISSNLSFVLSDNPKSVNRELCIDVGTRRAALLQGERLFPATRHADSLHFLSNDRLGMKPSRRKYYWC